MCPVSPRQGGKPIPPLAIRPGHAGRPPVEFRQGCEHYSHPFHHRPGCPQHGRPFRRAVALRARAYQWGCLINTPPFSSVRHLHASQPAPIRCAHTAHSAQLRTRNLLKVAQKGERIAKQPPVAIPRVRWYSILALESDLIKLSNLIKSTRSTNLYATLPFARRPLQDS